eukprot:scaffold552_cov526-Prasinococcus_capsulatus_cf.AAC.20
MKRSARSLSRPPFSPAGRLARRAPACKAAHHPPPSSSGFSPQEVRAGRSDAQRSVPGVEAKGARRREARRGDTGGLNSPGGQVRCDAMRPL